MLAPETTETHQLSVLIPQPIYVELTRRAEREGSPTSSVVRRMLADAVSGVPMVDARIGDGDATRFERTTPADG